jgi:hypothetical protein
LTELLVVLAVLALIGGMFLPAVQKARQQNERRICEYHLKQLGLGIHNVNDVYKKQPPVVGSFPTPQQNRGTLFFQILPFIEEDALYRKGIQNLDDPETYATVVKPYLNPADKSAPPNNRYKLFATSGFAANALVFGLGRSKGNLITNMPDGLSITIVFAERYQLCNGHPNAWGYNAVYYWAPMFAHYSLARFQVAPDPSTRECDVRLAQTSFASGMFVGMGDGSTRVLGPNLSTRTYRLAVIPNDGERMPEDWNP